MAAGREQPMRNQSFWGYAGLLVFTGCSITLSERNVNMMVSRALESREEASPYNMDLRLTDHREGGAGTVCYNVTRSRERTYAFTFPNGFKYWTTRDGCVLLDEKSKRAEVFKGLQRPSVEELEQSLRYIFSRSVRLNEIVVSLPARHRKWKGYRACLTPRVRRPLLACTEVFMEKRTGALPFSRERDTGGNVERELHAQLLKAVDDDFYREPVIPEGFRTAVFDAGAGGGTVPDWANHTRKCLDVLSRPRCAFAEGLAVQDFSRGGFRLVLFARKAAEGTLLSPAARAFDIQGIPMHYWLMGELIMFRWRQSNTEWTILTTLPPELAYDFIKGNVKPD